MHNCQEHEITIVLDSLRSAHNTGNIFRLADAVGASELICCGTTPSPPHPKLARTAMGSDRNLPSRYFSSASEALEVLRSEKGCSVLAVESGLGGTPAFGYDYSFPLVLVFGNEALGIADETISRCDGIVYLPMFGEKSSINVGNCAAVVLYAAVDSYEKQRKGNRK